MKNQYDSLGQFIGTSSKSVNGGTLYQGTDESGNPYERFVKRPLGYNNTQINGKLTNTLNEGGVNLNTNNNVQSNYTSNPNSLSLMNVNNKSTPDVIDSTQGNKFAQNTANEITRLEQQLIDYDKMSKDNLERNVADIERDYARREAEAKESFKEQEGTAGVVQFRLGQSGTPYQAAEKTKAAKAKLDFFNNLTAEKTSQISALKAAYAANDFEAVNSIRGNIYNLQQQQEKFLQEERAAQLQAAQDAIKATREETEYQQKQEDRYIKNLIPSIYGNLTGDSATDLQTINDFSEQYGIDKNMLMGNLISYKSAFEKEQLLNSSTVANILSKTTYGGTVNIPGLGEAEILGTNNESKAPTTLKAGGKIYNWAGGKWSDTGISDSDFTPSNIISALSELEDTTALENYLRGQGVNVPGPGGDPITGAPTDPSKVINGYNFTSYATDPNWGNAINNILGRIGEVSYPDEIDQYIKKVSPQLAQENKGRTSQLAFDIFETAEEYGIEPSILTAILQHESNLTNSNVAKNNNNPGGVTWNTNFPESMKGTARPANEGGNYVKFPTMKDGIAAVANNIARRKQDQVSSETAKFLIDEVGIDPDKYKLMEKLGVKENDMLSAAQIMQGNRPPLVATERARVANKGIMEALGVMGYNAVNAELDWQEQTKVLSSMNTAQQVRYRQTIFALEGSLEQAKRLYNEWKNTKLPSGFKAYNALALNAAANLPGEAGKIAITLKSHIADMQQELAAVYKGGNSPTEEFLKQARLSISADWNEETFMHNVRLIGENLQIRKNAVMASYTAEGNRYSGQYEDRYGNPTPQDDVSGLTVEYDGQYFSFPDVESANIFKKQFNIQ